MQRSRAWRRHIKDVHTIRRLRSRAAKQWYWFRTANFESLSNTMITHYIKTEIEFKAKTLSTSPYDSKNKSKFSPNKSKEYWRYKGSKGTREFERLNFRKILKENELI